MNEMQQRRDPWARPELGQWCTVLVNEGESRPSAPRSNGLGLDLELGWSVLGLALYEYSVGPGTTITVILVVSSKNAGKVVVWLVQGPGRRGKTLPPRYVGRLSSGGGG